MSALDRFLHDYQRIRHAEGWGADDPTYYQKLPQVPADDPQRQVWRVRQASFRALLPILAAKRRVLDVGAGNGWLAYQLARRGHSVVAIDVNDDDRDGLGALRYYPIALGACRADFSALPFDTAEFDCVVFGASLHYASTLEAVLTEALRVLARDGTIVVMDSPLYHDRKSGHAMLADKKRSLQERFDLEMAPDSIGFITFADFQRLAESLALTWRRVEPYVDLPWATRHLRARLQGRREPARFGLMIAQRDMHGAISVNAHG